MTNESDTPRTNALCMALCDVNDPNGYEKVGILARTLERELSAARQRVVELEVERDAARIRGMEHAREIAWNKVRLPDGDVERGQYKAAIAIDSYIRQLKEKS